MNNFKLFTMCLIVICFGLLNCISVPIETQNATLSKTRELYIQEIDSNILISAIQYSDKSKLILTGYHSLVLENDDKKFAIFSIQIQNVKKKEQYDLSSIVLVNENEIFKPEHLKYFKGNSARSSDWNVNSINYLNGSLLFTPRKKGIYTINLIYAVDKNILIEKAILYGQLIEFELELTTLYTIDKFN